MNSGFQSGEKDTPALVSSEVRPLCQALFFQYHRLSTI